MLADVLAIIDAAGQRLVALHSSASASSARSIARPHAGASCF
jgi:hypothetical protein